ncbi:sugar 3,4-ketoisomerase [Ferruginibacter profundus]
MPDQTSTYTQPYIIEFPKIGNSGLGYISVAENDNLPFAVKRIYWTYYTPEDVERGGHAHYDLEQILVAVSGKIIVNTEMPGGIKERFILETPNVGLFLPKFCWHVMRYSHNSAQMCIANMVYEEKDYIRDYEKFKMVR